MSTACLLRLWKENSSASGTFYFSMEESKSFVGALANMSFSIEMNTEPNLAMRCKSTQVTGEGTAEKGMLGMP